MLNADIPGAVSSFADVMKEFELKEKLYRIIFRGKALEFEAYRNYAPDDDARNIDWKASRRANKMLVKQYREERDLDIIFVVDVSDHMVFGSSAKIKCEFVAEMVGAFMHLILNANDKIGLLMYSDKVVQFVEPNQGTNHFFRLTDLLLDSANYGGTSDISVALKELVEYPTGMDSLIFVSDFVRLGTDVTRNLIALTDRAESLAIIVKDPVDLRLPKLKGEITLEDPTSGQQLLINPSVAQLPYSRAVLHHERVIRRIFQLANIDYVRLLTNTRFDLPLARFLEERVRQRGAFM